MNSLTLQGFAPATVRVNMGQLESVIGEVIGVVPSGIILAKASRIRAVVDTGAELVDLAEFGERVGLDLEVGY